MGEESSAHCLPVMAGFVKTLAQVLLYAAG
jgi:hypothetical protein